MVYATIPKRAHAPLLPPDPLLVPWPLLLRDDAICEDEPDAPTEEAICDEPLDDDAPDAPELLPLARDDDPLRDEPLTAADEEPLPLLPTDEDPAGSDVPCTELLLLTDEDEPPTLLACPEEPPPLEPACPPSDSSPGPVVQLHIAIKNANPRCARISHLSFGPAVRGRTLHGGCPVVLCF